LPRTTAAEVIGRQLVRSAASVGANYRAACRGKSAADVIAKLGIVEEEADETAYWLELLAECGLVASARLADLLAETDEILAMTVASIKPLRSRQRATSPATHTHVVRPQSKIANPKSKIGLTREGAGDDAVADV
jgi:four helix bundle protein